MSRSLFNKAHGAAREHGQELVVEAPPLKDVAPGNARQTEEALRVRAARGRPFSPGNKASAGRRPILAGIGVAVEPVEGGSQAMSLLRQINRRALALRNRRLRELAVEYGLDRPSSAVGVEVAAWALATSWSRANYDAGKSEVGAKFAERASGHMIRAIAIAERESKARPANARGALPPWLEFVGEDEASEAIEVAAEPKGGRDGG